MTIHDPVYVEDGVTLSNATIGPNVTLGKGSVVEGSTLTDTIVGSKCTIKHSTLHNSLIGDDVIIEGLRGTHRVGSFGDSGFLKNSHCEYRVLKYGYPVAAGCSRNAPRDLRHRRRDRPEHGSGRAAIWYRCKCRFLVEPLDVWVRCSSATHGARPCDS